MVSPKPQNQMPHSQLTHIICICEQSIQFLAKGCDLTPKEIKQVTVISQVAK